MRLALSLIAAIALTACSPAATPKVDQAGADLKAAGQAGDAAVENLAGAAVVDAKTGAARAATATGTAMERAGSDLKAQANK